MFILPMLYLQILFVAHGFYDWNWLYIFIPDMALASIGILTYIWLWIYNFILDVIDYFKRKN